MNLGQLSQLLREYPGSSFRMELPSSTFLPEHFHVTEVGKVTRCCVANYFEHRISTSKRASILAESSTLGLEDGMEVDFEVQGDTIEYDRTSIIGSLGRIPGSGPCTGFVRVGGGDFAS